MITTVRTVRRNCAAVAEQAALDLQDASAQEILRWAVGRVRQRTGGDGLDAGHRAGAPGLDGAAGHRCAVPGHRLPLRRDHRHRRRRRGWSTRHAAPPAAAADRRRAGRRIRPRAVRPRPRPVLRPAQGRPAESAPWPDYDAWATGLRRAESATRANTPVVAFDAKRQGQDRPAGRLDRRGRAGPTSSEHGVLVNPLLSRRVPVDRLRALHPPGRSPDRTPGPADGPAWPRPNAGSTYDARTPTADRTVTATDSADLRPEVAGADPAITGRAPGFTLWLTGLPSAGKTTLAIALAGTATRRWPGRRGAGRRRDPPVPFTPAWASAGRPAHPRASGSASSPNCWPGTASSCWSR